MQDIHHIGGGSSAGGGGRFFGGADRRLRPHNHPNHQALKCPRCDSLNTKFCYYNNYNLSQPRHFCKSCRRYWTKGGVLRNVPVGGGCRKTKRSKQKNSASSSGDDARERSSTVNQSSSSESSSLTAATTTAATPTSKIAAPAEEGSALNNTPPSSTAVFTFADARFITANPNFDPPPIINHSTDGQIFATDSFANLISSPSDVMPFSVDDIPTTSYEPLQRGNQAPAPDNPPPAMVDQSGSVQEFKMPEMNDDGLAAALDWGNGGGGGGDPGIFDLTAVDPAYWSQPQWTDSDNQSLNYLP